MSWRASVLTLFPEMFPGPLGVSLIGKALEKRLWSLDVRDIREHGLGKHRTGRHNRSGRACRHRRVDLVCKGCGQGLDCEPDAQHRCRE